MLKIYSYRGCSTCRKALKWLAEKQIPFEEVPVREQPPAQSELSAALQHNGGRVRALFNVSGSDYRTMGLKDRIAKMTKTEAAELLSMNGNLVKRPFAVDVKEGVFLSGFEVQEWAEAFGTGA